jgi:hypothetical protein
VGTGSPNRYLNPFPFNSLRPSSIGFLLREHNCADGSAVTMSSASPSPSFAPNPTRHHRPCPLMHLALPIQGSYGAPGSMRLLDPHHFIVSRDKPDDRNPYLKSDTLGLANQQGQPRLSHLWDDSLVAIAKFYNLLYSNDVSLTCGTHLCH